MNREVAELKSKKEKSTVKVLQQEDIIILNSEIVEERNKIEKSICVEKVQIGE